MKYHLGSLVCSNATTLQRSYRYSESGLLAKNVEYINTIIIGRCKYYRMQVSRHRFWYYMTDYLLIRVLVCRRKRFVYCTVLLRAHHRWKSWTRLCPGCEGSAVISPALFSTLSWMVGRLVQFIFSALLTVYCFLFLSCLLSESNHSGRVETWLQNRTWSAAPAAGWLRSGDDCFPDY